MKDELPQFPTGKPPATSLERVRQQFEAAGISVAAWARANHFKRMTVVDILRGRSTGLRGEAHRVAVALGLKQGVVVDVAAFNPAATRKRASAKPSKVAA